MCGIAGIVDLRGYREDEAVVQRMTNALTHRGPDGSGFHFKPGVGFGHRRLSIIDLAGGKQPLYNEDKTVVVTYNGEIYNYRSLAEELISLGHEFRTHCDTEVIVHAWEEWGAACVDRFNGMFAFALWDERKETLFLARDRLGIKPLYYSVLTDGRIVFGSELKALVLCPDLQRKISPFAVEDFFTFGYIPDPKTIYSGTAKLEPAHFLLVRRGESHIEPTRYWDVPLDGPSVSVASSSGIQEELRQHLLASVERRLIADVPLGAFLSGGIDSSAVVAMMRELNAGSILTCSIGFDEQQYDESHYADMVAGSKRTDHNLEFVDAADFSLLDRLVGLYDEPYADSSAIPTYRVCELARKHVTVALSGDGGDESFIGYRRYRLFSAEERIRSAIPYSIRRLIFGPLGTMYPKLDWAPRVFRGKTTFQALARDAVEAYLHGVSIFPKEARNWLFSKDLRADLQGYESLEVFRNHLRGKSFEDPMRMVQYLDFKTYLPGDILTKVDRASMAHSLEVRVPFLDHEFVSWAAKVPTSEKLWRGEGKYTLKHALKSHLPHEVLFRKKMGFAVPIGHWFRDSLRERLNETLTGERLRDCGLFSVSGLDRLVTEHQSGRRTWTAALWGLLMFDGFLRAEHRQES